MSHFAEHTSRRFILYYIIFLKYLLQNYISDLANIIKNFPEEEFVVECVGILGNLNMAELEYSMMLKEYDLLNFIKSKIVPGTIQRLFY